MRNLAKLQKDEHILGLTNVVFEKDRLCSACQAEKQVGAHHPSKNILSSSRPLKLLHMDLFGPIAYISISGNKYGLVIIDDFSRLTWVFFLQDKSEAKGVVKKFIRRLQNEFELKVKRSDNGSEFRNTQVEEFLDEEGIKHKLSAPYTPQQNGIVERKNRTLIEAAKTMLDEYKTLDSFWEEDINIACHAANRLYLHNYLNKTPYEIITVRSLVCTTLGSLGVSVSYLIRNPKPQSLHPRLMKVFSLVMELTNMPIVFSTKPPVLLRPR
jgi:transposase InsO family protein